MNTGKDNLSPTQLAMQMRARRTKRVMMYNLCLFGCLVVLAGSYLGYLVLWKHATIGRPGGGDQGPVSDNNPSDAPAINRPTDHQPVAADQPSKYPARKFAFICDVSQPVHPRVDKFLRGALSGFGKSQMVDVMTLSADGSYASVTNGPVAMSTSARDSACEAVAGTPDALPASLMTALKSAIDEQPEAVYLLTTAGQIRQFGPDPLATVNQLAQGKRVQINCVIFTTDTDSKADLDAFKSLADGTHGAYLVQGP